jgi:hypothetical protein
MSIPLPPGAARFLAVTAGVTALYIALDAAWMGLASPALTARFANAVPGSDLDRRAREIAEAARTGPAVSAAQRQAAWRAGHFLGLASQFEHAARVLKTDWHAQGTRQTLAQAQAAADALDLGPVRPLTGSTLEAAGNLSHRIEADELGLAARIERAGNARQRHLFLAGMHSGKAAYTRLYATALDSNVDAPGIERHARLAGLPPALWQPLVQPPGATPEARRDAFIAAVQAVDAALQAGAGDGGTAR